MSCEQVISLEGKGRGVVASKVFEKDEFVVEYAGELINITTANQREDLYERDEKVGCYMYYFSHKGKHYWYVLLSCCHLCLLVLILRCCFDFECV